jgi:hypothetical protein
MNVQMEDAVSSIGKRVGGGFLCTAYCNCGLQVPCLPCPDADGWIQHGPWIAVVKKTQGVDVW